MPTPPPDPGRSSSAKRAPESGSEDALNTSASAGPTGAPSAREPSGSTDSHHPASDPISELFRKSGSSRRNANSDILQILANPGSNPAGSPAPPVSGPIVNTDDAPTIITKNQPSLSPANPVPLIVPGDQQSLAKRRLGHFELIESIGSGGMAAVLKARDLELGRIVALKILPPESARDPESITRFKQEARAAAKLDHENVARVYFCGEDQSLHFIAFEFVEGENLRVLIDRSGTIAPTDCILYMVQVAAGLNHAAERGVVHRDIKPSNIIITPDGRAKIVDMGLARHLDSLSVNGGVTQSGITLGTFDYISPEQALDPRRADVRSDIYSLGCTFYHALTGRPPVPEGTAARKLHAHQHVDPLDPRLLNPAIPDGLAAVLSGMMAKNPDQRFQTPTDLIAHLKGVMEQLKLAGDVVPSDSVVQGVLASQTGLNQAPKLRLSWLLAASAVAIAIAAFAMSTGTSGPQRVQPPWVNDNVNQKEVSSVGITPMVMPNASQTSDESAVAVSTIKQLIDSFSRPVAKIQVQLAPGKYNFDSPELKEGIALHGNAVELIGSTSGTTEFHLSASPHGNLTIKAESLLIRDVRFVIHPGSPLTDGPDGANHPIGLAIQSGNPVTLEDCSFYTPQNPQNPSEEETIAVSIASGTDAGPAKVKISRCSFAQMDIALQIQARSDVTLTDSGFSTRRSAIHLLYAKNEEQEPSGTNVKLDRSSFMLDPKSSVVDVGSSTDETSVTAGYCVFAAVGKAQEKSASNALGTILNIAKPQDGQFNFRLSGVPGQKNAYYRVNPIAVSSGDTPTLTYEECKTKKLPVEDRDAVVLAKRPWSNPFDSFEKDPWAAFALEIKTESAVFVKDDPTVIGAQFHNPTMRKRRAYHASVSTWPPVKPSLIEPTQKIWYPDLKLNEGEEPPPGIYPNLVKLLLDARPDEVILIKHDGLLQLPEIMELKSRGSTELHLTFKPADGYKPILTTPDRRRGLENLQLDQTLFRLMSGEVTFEGLQFLLKPSVSRNPFKVSAVTIVSGKGCTFSDCAFTLSEDDDQVAAVVRVADPDKVMLAMAEGTSRPIPEIKLNRCVIRGKGRGIWVEVSRTVKVELTQSLAAIDGPMILAEPAGKAVAGAKSSLTLRHVTALVGGPVMEMKGGKVGEMRASGLVPFEVHAEECLFLGVPGAGKPLVELDGIDPSEVNAILDWNVIKNGNRYANFEEGTAAMVVRPGGDGNLPKEWDWLGWFPQAHEPAVTGKPVMKLTFAQGPSNREELSTIKPSDLFLSDMSELKLDDWGANLKQLPDPVVR